MASVTPSPVQRALLDQLQTVERDFSYDWDAVRGGLAFARSHDLAPRSPQSTHREEDDGARSARLADFLKKNGALFGLPGGFQGLRLLRSRRDPLGFSHMQYQQEFKIDGDRQQRKPLEVYGSKLVAHFSPDGRLVEVQSACYPDTQPVNTVKVKADQLRSVVLADIKGLEGFRELQAHMKERKEVFFPLMQAPRLVVYPWKDQMVFAWATHGYGRLPREKHEDPEKAKDEIAFGQMFFNAETAELFLFAPTRKGAENPTTATGLGTLPLGGPFASRALQVVRVDATSTYRLKNTTKGRNIITYDANANSAWVYPSIPSLIEAGTIPVSEDTDGDHDWSRTAANTTDAERTSSQQPEVDEHATVADIYDWYAAIGGRVGWDDGGYSAPLVPNQTINVVAHTYDSSAATSRSINAFMDKQLVSGHWVSHLAFFDGDPTNASNPYDYLAGSKAIVAHEYQHAVTDFSFIDGMGNPGLTYDDWLAAVHEGLSDVFGGLYSGDWWMGREISSTGMIFRNLAFPRDSTCFDSGKRDHWDDRNINTGFGARYFRGDILAHAAYLMAQGGVHQRASRTPQLIPVRGMGQETASGRQVYKAARIYYRAVSEYLGNIGASTEIPANDENVFRTIRNGCVSAAIDLYGTGSAEHKTTVLAWYAVGLHPATSNYGADCTFLTWGIDWWMSRPYIGLTSPDWSSPDLFINNGGTSEWNAQVNVMVGGSPTQFENNVYFRVRNVGTLAANNVQVQFEYTKITAGGATWLPMTDKDGNIQSLNIGTLAAGQSNFPDSDQNSPPATASVKWWIPPLESGETVDHFCIRARVFSISDVNPHNSEVQSNVAYTMFLPGAMARLGFFIANDRREAFPLELLVTHTLPRDWRLNFAEPTHRVVLKPGETRRIHALIEVPARAGRSLEAPFDGRLRGSISGGGSVRATGTLHRGAFEGGRFHGLVALSADDGAHVAGRFEGSLDVATALLDGWIEGDVQPRDGGPAKAARVRFTGCLRPDRLINIGQLVDGVPASGLSVQIQVPLPAGGCFEELPPTDTIVKTGDKRTEPCLADAAELIKCLKLDSEKVCSVDVRSVVLEVHFKQRDRC